MSTERVDKQWKTKGLTGYSTEAILGTLTHYGVAMTEASFKDSAKEQFPLEIAGHWRGAWKGTGQFQLFPYAAADELSRRFFPERLTPMQMAQALMEAMSACVQLLDGKPNEADQALAKLEAAKAHLPPPGERRNLYNGEILGFLDNWRTPFSELPGLLARGGKKAEALRFAAMHETLFPEREGCVTALVEALAGERGPALEKLVAIAKDAARDEMGRAAALEGLAQADANAELETGIGLAVFDACAAKGRWPLADSIAHLLASAVQKTGKTTTSYADEVAERFSIAHRHVGGHGH